MIKGIAMAQRVNRLRNSIFVNPPPLPLSCEISGALHLAEPGLTAGRQAAVADPGGVPRVPWNPPFGFSCDKHCGKMLSNCTVTVTVTV